MRGKVARPRSGSHKIDIAGQKFGMLKVLKYHSLNKHCNKIWECKCDCGNITLATTHQLRSGNKTSCRCNQYKKGAGVYNYTGYMDITGSRWYTIRYNAKMRDLTFKITKKDAWEVLLEQKCKCALSGLPVTFKDNSASVDRIDSDIGYTKNNIQIVHKDVNLMRNKFSVAYFKEMCERIVKHTKKGSR